MSDDTIDLGAVRELFPLDGSSGTDEEYCAHVHAMADALQEFKRAEDQLDDYVDDAMGCGCCAANYSKFSEAKGALRRLAERIRT